MTYRKAYLVNVESCFFPQENNELALFGLGPLGSFGLLKLGAGDQVGWAMALPLGFSQRASPLPSCNGYILWLSHCCKDLSWFQTSKKRDENLKNSAFKEMASIETLLVQFRGSISAFLVKHITHCYQLGSLPSYHLTRLPNSLNQLTNYSFRT